MSSALLNNGAGSVACCCRVSIVIADAVVPKQDAAESRQSRVRVATAPSYPAARLAPGGGE